MQHNVRGLPDGCNQNYQMCLLTAGGGRGGNSRAEQNPTRPMESVRLHAVCEEIRSVTTRTSRGHYLQHELKARVGGGFGVGCA